MAPARNRVYASAMMTAMAPRRVSESEDGLTLAAFLRRERTGLTWSQAREMCRRGRVSVDGASTLDPATRLAAGQALEIREEPGSESIGKRLSIVFEDAHVVAIEKPAGISSVPYERGERGTAMALLRVALLRKVPVAPLYVVHRLDKDASGLLLFARTRAAERAVGSLFRRHEIERVYVAVVHGRMASRRIESELVRDRGDGLRGSSRVPGRGKRAVTHVTAVRALEGATLCRVRLETGKTHQIRIHLAEAGHPIVGERVYIRDFLASGKIPFASSRLLLHAETLAFLHPLTGERIRLRSPVPAEFDFDRYPASTDSA